MRSFIESHGVTVYVPKAYFSTYGVRQTRAVEQTVGELSKRYGKQLESVTINRVTLHPDRMHKWSLSYSYMLAAD